MTQFRRKVLVLDSRFEATRLISLEQAFVLLYTKRAESLVESDRTLRSVNQCFQVPWIILLNGSPPKHRLYVYPRLSRLNVYLRDGFRCQYCMKVFPESQLTIDHVHPFALGGKTTWGNVLSACRSCNFKKGSRTLDELGIKLKQKPEKPVFKKSWLFALRYGIRRDNIPDSWGPYIDFTAIDRIYGQPEPEYRMAE